MTATFQLPDEWETMCWRNGRKVGNTLYVQLGPKPSDDDPIIGVMFTAGLAAVAVRGHNAEVAGS
jgi:hypothetical protein